MEQSGPVRPVSRRRRRRLAGAGLTAILLMLTAGAVLGSARQAQIMREISRAGELADSYQNARYLAVLQSAQLQAAVVEPGGEEHSALPGTMSGLEAELVKLVRLDARHSANLQTILDWERRLRPTVARFLGETQLQRVVPARTILEQELEPIGSRLNALLVAEAREHDADYHAGLAAANRENDLLVWGTAVLFLVGLGVLGLTYWSSRGHRRTIERMAVQDGLTGLPNRTAFQARTEVALAEYKGGGVRAPTALVLDLDGFKDVNDTLGHHFGDLLLIEVAGRLRSSLRAGDTVARLGGDEFAMLIMDADPAAGEEIAARICQVLTTPFVLDGVSVDIEASVGIATAEPGQDVTAVVRHADVAMYTAKEHRLGYSRYEDDQQQESSSRLNVLGAMRRALDDDEIVLHYQPKIDVGTGRLLGVEGLARWQHPTRGLVGPPEFIPVVENTSLVHRFTAHVLGVALAQARVWLDRGTPVPVAVNVSTRCLLDREFPETVAAAIMSAGVTGDLLCIEITENTVMTNPDRAIDVLRRIRALGVKTSIDDFGTGYSSMAYLKILPVDEIKVDRSFVQDMATDSGNRTLVESAVELGHNLGLAVVAEGVEDDSTLRALRSVGCDIAQGFHVSRPVPAAELDGWLRRTTLSSAADR